MVDSMGPACVVMVPSLLRTKAKRCVYIKGHGSINLIFSKDYYNFVNYKGLLANALLLFL